MRASLDTNVVIHFYRAGLQNILFDFFDEGVCIYEQIRNVELAGSVDSEHCRSILSQIVFCPSITGNLVHFFIPPEHRQQQ